MKISADQHRPLGKTGLRVPPIVFGSSALSDAARVIPDQTKLAICGEWFQHVAPPVFVDAMGDYGRGTGTDVLGKMLKRLDIPPEELVINIRLPLRRLAAPDKPQSAEAIRQCLKVASDSLGEHYLPLLVTLDEFDQQPPPAFSLADSDGHLREIIRALDALGQLKASGQIAGVGMCTRNIHLVRQIIDTADLDFVILVGGVTIMRHSPDLLDVLTSLAQRQIAVISAGIFHCGFLVGGPRFDNRVVRADDPADRHLFAWRKAFAALCHGYGVSPAHACIQFALSPPSIVAVLLNTSHPDRIAKNVASVVTKVPDGFWASMKEEGLLVAGYAYLG